MTNLTTEIIRDMIINESNHCEFYPDAWNNVSCELFLNTNSLEESRIIRNALDTLHSDAAFCDTIRKNVESFKDYQIARKVGNF